MTIEIKRSTDTTRILLTGRLDTTTAPALEKTLREDVGEAAQLVLDIKELEYISSAGLRVLLGAQKRLGDSMKLTHVGEMVMEVFEMTGFADILNIEA